MIEIWRGTWVVAYRELLRFVSDRSRLLSSLFMPLLFLIIFGAGFTKALGPLARNVNYIQFMYPGLIAMTVLTSSLFAGMSVVWDREVSSRRSWSLRSGAPASSLEKRPEERWSRSSRS